MALQLPITVLGRVVFILFFATVASLMNCVGQVRGKYQGHYSFILTEIVLTIGYIVTYFSLFLYRFYVGKQITKQEVNFVWGTGNCFVKDENLTTRGGNGSGLMMNSIVGPQQRANINSSDALILSGGSSANNANANHGYAALSYPADSETTKLPQSWLERCQKSIFYPNIAKNAYLPMYCILVFAGVFDCLSEVLGFLVQPYMRVFTRALITQSNIVFASLWSMNLLSKRYVFLEVLGIAVAASGALVDVYGGMMKHVGEHSNTPTKVMSSSSITSMGTTASTHSFDSTHSSSLSFDNHKVADNLDKSKLSEKLAEDREYVTAKDPEKYTDFLVENAKTINMLTGNLRKRRLAAKPSPKELVIEETNTDKKKTDINPSTHKYDGNSIFLEYMHIAVGGIQAVLGNTKSFSSKGDLSSSDFTGSNGELIGSVTDELSEDTSSKSDREKDRREKDSLSIELNEKQSQDTSASGSSTSGSHSPSNGIHVSSPSTDSPLAVLILFLACATPAMVLKELVYLRWREGHTIEQKALREKGVALGGKGSSEEEGGLMINNDALDRGLINNDGNGIEINSSSERLFPKPHCDVFVVCFANNLFSALFAPFLCYVLTRLQIPNDVTFYSFLSEALHELWYNEEIRFWTIGCYLPINLFLNVMVLFILASTGGAVLLFVAFKLTLPLSVIFAIILPWPSIIGNQTITIIEGIGGTLVFIATFLFMAGNKVRDKLEKEDFEGRCSREERSIGLSGFSGGESTNIGGQQCRRRTLCMYPYSPYLMILVFAMPIGLSVIIFRGAMIQYMG